MLRCSKPICGPPGSPKTYFVFSLNSMYHMFSKVFDSQDLTFPLIYVKSCPTVRVCMVKISQNFNKICFMPCSTTLSMKKTDLPEKKSKAVKDRGGGHKVSS